MRKIRLFLEFLTALIGGCVLFATVTYSVWKFYDRIFTPEQGAELYHPHDEYGARIPGTNYIVEGRDTLEIVKSYRYRILDKQERIQAREYIKSIRDNGD